MQCPPEIAEIICEILKRGMILIRNSDNLVRSQSQADHLHNLPSLLTKYKPELLDFYWSVERVCFIKRSESQQIQEFEPLWKALAAHVDSRTNAVLAGRNPSYAVGPGQALLRKRDLPNG